MADKVFAMASNLDCLGLGVATAEEFADLVERIGPRASLVARTDDGTELLRWEDPSGARLLLTRGKRGITRVVPSFGGERVVRLGGVRRVNGEAAVADVVVDGEMVTRLGIELEELPLLGDSSYEGAASVVALAPEVRFLADAEAFAASDFSLLAGADAGPRPEHFDEDLPWPPRLAAESFIPTGMFASSEEGLRPVGLLNGVVRYAERRTTMLTGQEFVVVRVRSAGFEVDVCLPGGVDVPLPGVVLSADVFLTGSVEMVLPVARRRWFLRR
ncbi:hypothetical protein BWI15_04430 [Kribbella sp. ALI-6-A]|uniref:hypothetical protein n=1 Tax=Kribbella sp. ALI-6-A TaxID=1933817 RepID=UPI00097C1CDE|nr:hypothetical protein [Kribbella sp. ALI-6-A]ONI76559.1 hypothetical protein BWI15_04430 [Kribbella sp. ALI-6-A]